MKCGFLLAYGEVRVERGRDSIGATISRCRMPPGTTNVPWALFECTPLNLLYNYTYILYKVYDNVIYEQLYLLIVLF